MTFRTIFRFLLISFSHLMAGYVIAQSSENTLLYKIDFEDGPDSYLFGTIHLLPQSEFVLKDKVKRAFAETEELVMEVDLSDPSIQMKMMKLSLMKDDKTLKEVLSEEEYILLANRLKETAGINIEMVSRYKPFVVSTFLLPDFMGGETASFEMVLLTMARKDSLKISGLEDVESQMAIFDTYSYEDQADDLIEMLTEEDKTRDLYDKMVSSYKKEDLESLFVLMDDYFETEEELDLFLYQRNKNWLEILKNRLGEESLFIAVGAGHLPSERGLVELLRAEGYNLIPIQD